MEDSILNSVKKQLGIDPSYDAFDGPITMHINSIFQILYQLGVGPDLPFIIDDASSTWDEFTDDIAQLSMVKTYVGLKVQQVFDPPQSGAVADAAKRMIEELEWRLNVQVDPDTTFTGDQNE